MAYRSGGPKVLAIVLAGGEGKRLMPLTRDRAKPAVPFGGIYRLVDFALSNVAIMRGAPKGTSDNGAFLSLLMTVLISGACWVVGGNAAAARWRHTAAGSRGCASACRRQPSSTPSPWAT